MKKNFLKKLAAALGLGVALISLGACQSVEQSAYVDTSNSACEIFTKEGSTTKWCRYVLTVVNPSIYNAYDFEVNFTAYKTVGAQEVVVKDKVKNETLGIAHGCAGSIYGEFQLQDQDVHKIVVNNGAATRFSNIWDTYLAAWIICIVCLSLAVIFYCIDLFVRNISPETVIEKLRERIATSLVIFGLCLIICLIPLLFASWVVSLIILGSYLSFLVIAGLLTLIRWKAAKKAIGQ